MIMSLKREVKILFKNNEGNTAEITITLETLLDKTSDDFFEILEDTIPCTSASCNNESQNFCDCGGNFEDYEIYDVVLL